MKTWKINYNGGWDHEWIEASTKAQAKKLWQKENPGIELTSVEERVSMESLMEEAIEKINEKLNPTKHLEVDDFRCGDNRFLIPVFHFELVDGFPEHREVASFDFSRKEESEAWMVMRFHSRLHSFLEETNWKKLDK